MASAEYQEVLPVERAKLFRVITRYEDYPQFVTGVTKVAVERKAPGRARVTYHVSMMKDVVYTVDLIENEEKGRVEWSLVEGDVMKTNSGFWELKDAGAGKTDVRYGVEVDFKIFVPGMILNKLVKGSLPSMVKSFGERAAAHG